MKKEYQYDWASAFEKAFEGKRNLLDEHIKQAKNLILMPLLKAKSNTRLDAEEICSLVITKFWERFYTKEEALPNNVNGYIYTMANNALFYYTRMQNKAKKQTINVDTLEWSRVFNMNADKTDGIAEKQKQEQLLVALEHSFKQLGDKCQLLLKLFIYEKKRMKDIHKDLGIPTANAATKKKESCINNLRKLMYKEVRNKNHDYV